MLKTVLLFIVGSLSLSAQSFYSVNKTTVASSSTEVITVQQPNSGANRIVRFVSAHIDCTADCTYTVERNGSAATAGSTPITPAPANPNFDLAATTLAYSASDCTVGTIVTRGSIPAGGFVIINLSNVYFRGLGGYQNLTIRIGSFTGTVDINLGYTESNQ